MFKFFYEVLLINLILLKIVPLQNLYLIALRLKRFSCGPVIFFSPRLIVSYFFFKSVLHFELVFASVSKHRSVVTIVC